MEQKKGKQSGQDHHFGEEIRGGTRGGLEEFKWDTLRGESQRDRECYLGSSLKLGMLGKMGKYRRHDWWTEKVEQVDKETSRLKKFEETLLEEAVGARPKFLLLSKSDRDQLEEKERQINISHLTSTDGPTDEAIETLMVEKQELELKLEVLISKRKDIEKSLSEGVRKQHQSGRRSGGDGCTDFRREGGDREAYQRHSRRDSRRDNDSSPYERNDNMRGRGGRDAVERSRRPTRHYSDEEPNMASGRSTNSDGPSNRRDQPSSRRRYRSRSRS